MANRFDKTSISILPSDNFYRVISVVIFVLIAVFFIQAVEYSGRSSIEKEQESLENAISRDIVQCYALEGMYPPSLSYMEDHYGLTYDKNVFFVDYQPIAANLYPDYTVILR
ncbi:MAG: hypothetical protein E7305_02930 [Butyrivibrio sp.]|jgi:hypothetical protein|nr:hypothetical protein [Butyrivibrio sp.]MBE5824977.1 hypothetical protein [Butyrivibrio sp.]MBE5828400.1 hypothetical protein [Butyrivibrio sp.]MBR1642270.1 hypothetical protein [Butyrivibrio sp.]